MKPVTLSAGDIEVLATYVPFETGDEQRRRIVAWLYQARRHASQGDITTVPEKQFLEYIVSTHQPKYDVLDLIRARHAGEQDGIHSQIRMDVQAFGGGGLSVSGGAVCKGCMALGSGCGKCARCRQEIANQRETKDNSNTSERL